MKKETKPFWGYGLNAYYGGVLRYKPEMPKLQSSNLHGFELFAHKVTNGARQWERLFNYPELGIGLAYFNYGISELGYAVSATSYLDLTLNNRKRNKWKLNIGNGLVYSSERYNEFSNPGNKAISSRISYVARAAIRKEFKVTENYYLNASLGFRHYSNGKLNVPNNGMNFPTVGFGFKYIPKPKTINYINDTISGFDRSIHLNVSTSTAWREVLREDSKHRAYSVSLYLSKQMSKYNTILLGLDGFLYDKTSMKLILDSHKALTLPEDFVLNYDGRQVGATLGSEILIGKLNVLVQGGYYIYKPQIIYDNWYQRYGFKYMVLKDVYIQVMLKAHSRTADMTEFGFGLKL